MDEEQHIEDDDASQTAPDGEMETSLREYRKLLAESLNRNVDALERTFLEIAPAVHRARGQIPNLRRLVVESTRMAQRSAWFRERANGRRMPSTRRQAILWEIEYRSREFRLFLHRHRRWHRGR